ncbi:LIM/homeobox protein Awh-like [Anneissia japonica]|uniref:LIM/homeobox protein Awh-like n=1 Tax=Anneissia japonica TaxID=1529436 RepID=UPI00142594B5|nr:LIM/homeobox protein Awh-like [Anneissia japonica]
MKIRNRSPGCIFSEKFAKANLTSKIGPMLGTIGNRNVIVKTEPGSVEDFTSDDESMSTDSDGCVGCGDPISDRFLLKVGHHSWHTGCLHCCVCACSLSGHHKCYFKDGQVYCKIDYVREFGTKCARCKRGIQSSDWVRRAKHYVFHLACFACDNCKRQLSTGEEFAMMDNRVLCKAHYMETVELSMKGGSGSDGDSSYDSSSGQSRMLHRPKRIRTTFSEEQLEVLQANFQVDSNPDGQDLERIATITGLSKRVTQVWFQNSRARQKKYQSRGGHNEGSPPSPPQSPCVKCGHTYCACTHVMLCSPKS